MSKVVLLSINAKYVHSSLAVWFLSAGVKEYSRLRHDVEVVEATIKQDNADIAERAADHMPDIIGISTYIWNAGKLPGLLKLLRQKLPDAVFALGGPEASHNAGYWIETGADYVLRGEGEQSFPALLDALEENDAAALKTIPGLCYKNGGFHSNPGFKTSANLIDPYGSAYFDALDGRIAYIETSRGCPFKCAYCLSGGSKLKFFPLDKIKEQVFRLSQSGAKTIKFA